MLYLLSHYLFSVPHYEVVKIHSVRHTVSKRSIRSDPYNAKDTLNSNYNQRHRTSDPTQNRQESDYNGNSEFSPSYNPNHGTKKSSSSPSGNLGITDVRWKFINGAVYPSTTKMLSSSLPSNPSPQSSNNSSSQSSQSTGRYYMDVTLISLLQCFYVNLN